MACFLVTAVEAVVVTAAAYGVKKSEKKTESVKLEKKAEAAQKEEKGMSWGSKLMLLAQLLWGGAFLLAFEHVWHGEVVPWFPFLTAMNDPGDTAEMLHEMSTIGVTMAVIVTVAWLLIVWTIDTLAKRPEPETIKSAA